jgi:hypothetical protein
VLQYEVRLAQAPDVEVDAEFGAAVAVDVAFQHVSGEALFTGRAGKLGSVEEDESFVGAERVRVGVDRREIDAIALIA